MNKQELSVSSPFLLLSCIRILQGSDLQRLAFVYFIVVRGHCSVGVQLGRSYGYEWRALTRAVCAVCLRVYACVCVCVYVCVCARVAASRSSLQAAANSTTGDGNMELVCSQNAISLRSMGDTGTGDARNTTRHSRSSSSRHNAKLLAANRSARVLDESICR